MSILRSIVNKYIELRSFRTNRKLLVIESDDWGSRRTDDKEVLQKLNAISSEVEGDPFTQFDNIASESDITALFEVLNSVKDMHGNPACMTINVTTANPDFEKIRDARFEQFFYEPFHQTILRRPDGKRILDLWKEGIDKKMFYPQLHGREHVHALAWLKELQLGNKELQRAFELNAYGIPYKALFKQRRRNLQAALDKYSIPGEELFQKNWVKDGAAIFKEYFGWYSKTLISPAYIWHKDIEGEMSINNIEAIQGIKLQYQPKQLASPLFNRRLHYTGEVNEKQNVKYLVRNVFFEPSSDDQAQNLVEIVLKQAARCFEARQPIILGSHRINFVGSLSPKLRDKNLAMLLQILSEVKKRWPTIEFIHSSQLLETIIKKNEE